MEAQILKFYSFFQLCGDLTFGGGEFCSGKFVAVAN